MAAAAERAGPAGRWVAVTDLMPAMSGETPSNWNRGRSEASRPGGPQACCSGPCWSRRCVIASFRPTRTRPISSCSMAAHSGLGRFRHARLARREDVAAVIPSSPKWRTAASMARKRGCSRYFRRCRRRLRVRDARQRDSAGLRPRRALVAFDLGWGICLRGPEPRSERPRPITDPAPALLAGRGILAQVLRALAPFSRIQTKDTSGRVKAFPDFSTMGPTRTDPRYGDAIAPLAGDDASDNALHDTASHGTAHRAPARRTQGASRILHRNGTGIRGTIAETCPQSRRSVRNLLHYLALRKHDLRDLQSSLAALGLSSLGRTESSALAGIEALIAILETLNGEHSFVPSPDADCIPFTTGPAILSEHTRDLMGDAPKSRAVRIMVTMPSEAGDSPELVRGLVEAAMDVMRVNCAHDSEGDWERMIAHMLRANEELGRHCKVLNGSCRPEAAHRLRPPREPRRALEGAKERARRCLRSGPNCAHRAGDKRRIAAAVRCAVAGFRKRSELRAPRRYGPDRRQPEARAEAHRGSHCRSCLHLRLQPKRVLVGPGRALGGAGGRADRERTRRRSSVFRGTDPPERALRHAGADAGGQAAGRGLSQGSPYLLHPA